MPIVETLAELAKPWAKFYSRSDVAQAVLTFSHLAGMLGGGGIAIAADRALWKARQAPDDVRTRVLAELAGTHRPVLIGLALANLSGLMMLAADIETYLPSPLFWGKMAALALLLVNGAWLKRLEEGAMRAPSTLGTAWPRVIRASHFSYALWFAVVLGGVLLLNV